MRKYIFSLCCYFTIIGLYAQDDCELTLKKAETILFKKSPFIDASNLISSLEPCVQQNNAKAQNYLGLAYLNGIGTEINKNKAFNYVSSAASGGYPQAQYNLGRMYKYGVGCDINFNKAIYWFEKAIGNGNQRAAYTLGYMYYKGFGVQQDYQKALYWFDKSTDHMAKHFLGLCHYLGYGTPANETKALEILLANPILNSKTLVNYIQKQQKEKIESAANEALQTQPENGNANSITKNLVASSQDELQYYPEQTLNIEHLNGLWTGKLIQYDWSKKHIRRVLPIKINFKVDEGSEEQLHVTTTIEDQNISSSALWQDETLYFKNLEDTFTLTKLFPENPEKLTLSYNILSTTLQQKKHEGSNYIIGNLDTYIPNWTEYGIPMSIIIQPEGTNNTIDQETLLALAAQEDQFIKLYPVPFNNQLTVQYQLETASHVYAELVSLNGTNTIVILPTSQQEAGSYTYNIPLDVSLPEGLYAVRLIAGNQVYTRMIIKDN